MPLGHDPLVGSGFPSGQTRSVCPEIMLKQKMERDDASKKSHPALVTMADANVGFGDTHMFEQTAETDPSKVTHLNRE